MDPIIIGVVVVLLILLVLRIFFGFAKLIFKLGIIIVIAVVLWRLFVHP
ncbi:MAG TPA: hypothetical protein VF021_02945 [Longimicrobiales bacterium]